VKHPFRWLALGVSVAVVGLAVVLAVTVKADPQADTRRTRLIDKPAPNVTVRTLDGETMKLADLKGKTVVVNFWNTWCIPCQEELPALQRWWAQHQEQDDVVLVGIVRDDTERAVRRTVQDEKIGWTIAMDPGGDAALEFGTRGQPETFVVGPLGFVRGAQLQPVTVGSLDTMVAAAQRFG
jgi:cytochrome c biogenesis protein CcmG/thiol:disulfide interchange protein DsbE